MKKQTAIEVINEFPKNFELDKLLERLIFIDKIEKGLKQADKGETLTHEKVIALFKKKWQK